MKCENNIKKSREKIMAEKVLSIKSIKEEIVNKLLNNMEILQYLETESFLKEGYTITNLRNNLIYDYDMGYRENCISVEVAEADLHTSTNEGKKYMVVIKIGTRNEEKVCDMSSVVADIVNKLYPDRRNFSNTSIRVKDNCISADSYGYSWMPTFVQTTLYNDKVEHLYRIITFEIH